MFDVGWTELVLIGVLALVIVGPRDLPQLVQMVGKAVRRFRRYYREVTTTFQQLENELDLAAQPAPAVPQRPEYWDLLPEHVKAILEVSEPLRDAEAYRARAEIVDDAIAAVTKSEIAPAIDNGIDNGGTTTATTVGSSPIRPLPA